MHVEAEQREVEPVEREREDPAAAAPILIAAAVGTTVPCVLLWIADQRDRMRGRAV
jgi:hypothetical protein